jgi:glycosyltransferase involved in cell wall biosynthesis
VKLLFIGDYDMAEHNIRPEAEMIIGLRALGLDVEVMTQGDCTYAERMRNCDIVVHNFTPRKKISREAINVIRDTLIEGRHDVVQLFNNRAIVNGIFAAWRLPTKVVNYRGQTGNVSRLNPSCYLSHLSPRVDKIVCVADAVRRSLAAAGVPERKLITIYKGHDPAWYADIMPTDLAKLGIPNGAFTICCVSTNRPRKGVPSLIEAVKLLPREIPWHLLLIGGGMDADDIRRAIPEGDAERFHLLGHVDDVLPIVAACQATVLPALRREGLPKTVIESMSLGVPAIGTTTGGTPELIVDGESGLLVPPGDSHAIAAAIQSLATDSDLASRIGTAGRMRIAEHFNLRDSIAAHAALYRKLTSAV